MTNDDKGGDGRNSLPPGLRQALEQLFIKYIQPVMEKLDRLELSLRTGDARDVANLRDELHRCRENDQALRHEIVELKTKAGMFEDSSKRWREKYEKLDSEHADQKLLVALLESKLRNKMDGAHD